MNENDTEFPTEDMPKFRFSISTTAKKLGELMEKAHWMKKPWFSQADLPYDDESGRSELKTWFKYLGFLETKNGGMKLTPKAYEFQNLDELFRGDFVREILLNDIGFYRLWVEISSSANDSDIIDKERAKEVFLKHYPNLSGSTVPSRFNVFIRMASDTLLWKKLRRKRGRNLYEIIISIRDERERTQASRISPQKSVDRIGSILYQIKHGHHYDVETIRYELDNLKTNDHISEDVYCLIIDILNQIPEQNGVDLHEVLSGWHYRIASKLAQKKAKR